MKNTYYTERRPARKIPTREQIEAAARRQDVLEEEEEIYDDVWPPRMPTSTRRYTNVPDIQTKSGHNVRVVEHYHNEPLIQRASRTPLPQSQTIYTTGHGHQAATQAKGYVTFYNSLTQPQTISAGTLLVGADGEQVVTNETVYIPAGNLITNGQATISAHAINYGSEGNIKAGDIYGACCRALIQVANSAFSGGQNERDFQAVAKGDIDQVVSSLTSQFQHTMQTYVLSHISPVETLFTPIPCSTTMQSNHPIGAEATLETVTFQKTCSPLSYNTGDLQHQAEIKLAQDVHIHLGNDYTLQGNIATSITKTAIRQQTILFSVSCSGSWARAFNTRHLATLISGKTPDQANIILEQTQGVTNTGIHLEGFTDRIPKNPDRIHFVFLYETA